MGIVELFMPYQDTYHTIKKTMFNSREFKKLKLRATTRG